MCFAGVFSLFYGVKCGGDGTERSAGGIFFSHGLLWLWHGFVVCIMQDRTDAHRVPWLLDSGRILTVEMQWFCAACQKSSDLLYTKCVLS